MEILTVVALICMFLCLLLSDKIWGTSYPLVRKYFLLILGPLCGISVVYIWLSVIFS